MTVHRQPCMPGDEPFLRSLILETIADEFGAGRWPEPLRSQILDLQYSARRQGVGAPGSGVSEEIVIADAEPAGWLVLSSTGDHIRLIEIMIAAANRNRGIGSEILRQVIACGAREGKPVRLSVNVTNTRAERLYSRLGFRRIGGNDVQHLMERIPPAEIC